jgi:pyruvate/2-oxoglutarate dehydrogenase complex dihydrolipoamide acyltransferase (E2) component
MEEVFIPAVGMAMEEAYIEEWVKQEGESVEAGDVVALIETDKAQLEVSCETSGTVGKHRFAVGDSVPVGETITVILAPGESE